MTPRGEDRWNRPARSEDPGSVIDDSVIVPFTPPSEVQEFLATPAKIAAWFGSELDFGQRTLVIGAGNDALIITAVENETTDDGRGQLLAGSTAFGPIRGYLTLRSVLCTGKDPSDLGVGTEIWTHIELPDAMPRAATEMIRSTVRRAQRHLHDELGT
jgi:hypothetical protein